MFTAVSLLLVLASLAGNTLVILTVLLNKPMQTTLNYLLVNLAVADIVFALCAGLRNAVIPYITHPEGEIGRLVCVCITDGATAWLGAAVSILSLVYIAVERYFAIVYPLRHRGRFTRKRLILVIAVGWIVSVVANISEFVESKYYDPDLRLCKTNSNRSNTEETLTKVNSLVWLLFAGIVPVSIMVYLYSRVVHQLWFKPVEHLEASQKASLRYRKQVTATLVVASVIYAICWIPNLTGYILENWGLLALAPWLDKTGEVLITFNSCVNPVLYSLRMKTFREHLRDMLLCKNRRGIRAPTGLMKPWTADVVRKASVEQGIQLLHVKKLCHSNTNI